jgi:hypothetical protein
MRLQFQWNNPILTPEKNKKQAIPSMEVVVLGTEDSIEEILPTLPPRSETLLRSKSIAHLVSQTLGKHETVRSKSVQ